jgi:hypothetical protein
MNKVRALLKQAHQQSQPLLDTSAKVKFSPPTVKTEPETHLESEAPPAPSVEETPRQATAKKKEASLPTGVLQIARDDIPVTSYGVKPVATNFNCYNRELFEWLRTFSSNNQFNGGCAITKSQLIEIALDVIYYDLGIKPIGYESQQALREDIQRRIKEAKMKS